MNNQSVVKKLNTQSIMFYYLNISLYKKMARHFKHFCLMEMDEIDFMLISFKCFFWGFGLWMN